MTRPRYEPVPRGYVRVWCVTDRTRSHLSYTLFFMRKHAEEYKELLRWMGIWSTVTVTPLDIPAGAVPGLRTTTKARKR